MLEYCLLALALLALLGIVFEEVIHVNKAKTTLFFGCLSWLILFIAADSKEASHQVQEQLNENLLEIATLWLFLMSTMTFVAYLNAKGLIQNVVQKIVPQELSLRALMFIVALFALLLSAICDNVTATLVSLGLLQAFKLEAKQQIKLAALVVFSVNSGGVALITGDVTTLMIFLDGHLSMQQLITLLLPASLSVLLLAMLLSIGAKGRVSASPVAANFHNIDIIIAVIFFATIGATMLLNLFYGVPPVLTFLSGLSLMFLVGRSIKTDAEQTRILEYIREIEYDTLLFFLGILLLVGMLQEVGVLKDLAQLYREFDPRYANYVAGAGSALLDNVPLTAALLKASPELNTENWLGLTYAVGVGGSLLAIGSAAGIIAMSKVQSLSFVSYLRYFPALAIAYTAGYAMTLLLANQLKL
ncbi:sodium:proton antiporter NhaD [uncultured Pseudoteredinibacter sp.]|uniref:sodium:proton antiporter NhaD n=1 Tax=uncultured Pseudoteredinibacter sp. TaxID=1641701 RepID=UPI00262C48D1|nr:sodium:proton antiporter NhaD [uncultured Pseudoteredinibacter sp.]